MLWKGKQVPFKKFPGKITAFLEIKFFVLYQHRGIVHDSKRFCNKTNYNLIKYIIFHFPPIGPERTNTAGRNSALATQHPILVYSMTARIPAKQSNTFTWSGNQVVAQFLKNKTQLSSSGHFNGTFLTCPTNYITFFFLTTQNWILELGLIKINLN